MRRNLTALVAACCLFGWTANVPADTPAGKGGIDAKQAPGEKEIKLASLDRVFMDGVNAAVAKGRQWLMSKARADGRWPTVHDHQARHGPYRHGGTALVLLTLIKSDVNPVRKEITRGLDFLEESWKTFNAGGRQSGKGAWKTYEAGITLMVLQAVDAYRPPRQPGHSIPVGAMLKPNQREWAKQLRDFLIANQAVTREVTVGGGVKGGRARLEPRKEAWHYPSGERLNTDHSNTQYAVLGLRAAAQLGLPSPKEVWLGVLENFIDTQEANGPGMRRTRVKVKDLRGGGTRRVLITQSKPLDRARGWSYPGGMRPPQKTGQHGPTGSMTTVGIACCAIAWHELRVLAYGHTQRRIPPDRKLQRLLRTRKLDGRSDKAQWDGIAWLASRWTVTANPNYGIWHYYYLYGLERAGILTGQPSIGTHDWYREGGDVLLKAQRGGGSWDDRNGDGEVCSTCFALLFLKRATVPLVATSKNGRKR